MVLSWRQICSMLHNNSKSWICQQGIWNAPALSVFIRRGVPQPYFSFSNLKPIINRAGNIYINGTKFLHSWFLILRAVYHTFLAIFKCRTYRVIHSFDYTIKSPPGQAEKKSTARRCPKSCSYSAVYGIRATCLALLIATVSALWCFAQFPVILLGRIFPLSETYLFNLFTSL